MNYFVEDLGWKFHDSKNTKPVKELKAFCCSLHCTRSTTGYTYVQKNNARISMTECPDCGYTLKWKSVAKKDANAKIDKRRTRRVDA